MLKADVRAEELEKKAKEEMKNKNYQSAFKLFEEAKQLYEQLNYKGKIGFCEKQLALLKRAIEYETGKGITSKPVIEKKEANATESVKEPLIDKTKFYESDTEKESTMLEAEQRRIRLRQLAKIGMKVTEADTEMESKIQMRQEYVNKQREDQDGKIKSLQERQKSQQVLQDKADWALDQAKMAFDSKEFQKAKTHYKEAIDVFKELGWFDQVGVLYEEIKNLQRYETEHLRKIKMKEINSQTQDEQFQQRVNGILEEKKQKEQRRLALLAGLTPEMKQNLEKADMLKEKAEKEINTNKLQRALGRYHYILELYDTIPAEKADLSDEISEIKKKIADLEAKM